MNRLGTITLLLFVFSNLPGSAQSVHSYIDVAENRNHYTDVSARVKVNRVHRKGTYFTPDECVPNANPTNKPIVTAKAILNGMDLLQLHPFSRLVVDGKSLFEVKIFRPGDKSALKGPGVYTSSPQSVRQTGDTVNITEYSGHFVIVTDHLNYIKNCSNGAVIVAGLDENNLAIDIESNGTVVISGKAKSLTVDVKENGTAGLERLLVNEQANVSLKENGIAHINTSGNLSGDVLSNGSLYYYGNPKSIRKSVLSNGTFERRTTMPFRDSWGNEYEPRRVLQLAPNSSQH